MEIGGQMGASTGLIRDCSLAWITGEKPWRMKKTRGRDRNRERAFEKNNMRQSRRLRCWKVDTHEEGRRDRENSCRRQQSMWRRTKVKRKKREPKPDDFWWYSCFSPPLMLFQWSLVFQRWIHQRPRTETISSSSHNGKLNKGTQHNLIGAIHSASIVSESPIGALYCTICLYCQKE